MRVLHIYIILIFAILSSCDQHRDSNSVNNSENTQTDSLFSLDFKPEPEIVPKEEKVTSSKNSNNFTDSSAKHNIPFKEFYADTTLLADMGRLFIIEGTVDELVFSNNAFVIKDLDGDLNYLIFPDDYPETISKLKKYLKVGSRVKSIYALAGARYLQVIELNIY